MDDKDHVTPRPEDIMTGKEIAPRKDDKSLLITDEGVRDVVRKFVPVLYKGMDISESFHNLSVGDKYALAVPMLEDEIRNWDSTLGLRDAIYDMHRKGLLYVPEIDANDRRLLNQSKYAPTEKSSSSKIVVEGGGRKKFRVNLDSRVETPILPFDPKGMKFFIKPKANLSGYASSKGRLYNAFMAVDTYVQDRHGRWAITQIPGTGVSRWMGDPVYSVFRPAGADVWFNTRVDEKKQNNMEIKVNQPHYAMTGCEIHHPEQINNLEVPNDRKLRLLYWQLDRFINKSKIKGRNMPPLLRG